MKHIHLVLPALAAVFSSCETYVPLINTVSLREDLVMPPHQKPVEVLYLKESLDKKPVTELAMIHINHGLYTPEDRLVEQARQKARELGADGIFVLNREEYMRYFNGDVYISPEVARTEFRAVAFVYDERLKDSVRVHEARLLAEQERPVPRYFMKSSKLAQIYLYQTPEIKEENIARIVTDAEPMELLERTAVEVYNPKRTMKSHLFKVKYQAKEYYVSGFDIVLKPDGGGSVE